MHSGNIPLANARVTITALDATPQTAFAAVAGATGSIYVSDIHWSAGAGAAVIIFRAVDNSPEYFRVNVGAAATRALPFPIAFAASEGLEVLTTGGTGVEITFFYWKPGAYGLGV